MKRLREGPTSSGIPSARSWGRPRSKAPVRYGWIDDQTLVTSAGVTIRRARDGKGHILRFEGEALTSDLMESLMLEIRALLEK